MKILSFHYHHKVSERRHNEYSMQSRQCLPQVGEVRDLTNAGLGQVEDSELGQANPKIFRDSCPTNYKM